MRAYKIKPFLFLYAVSFLAATKTLHKRKEKVYFPTVAIYFVFELRNYQHEFENPILNKKIKIIFEMIVLRILIMFLLFFFLVVKKLYISTILLTNNNFRFTLI